MKVLALGHWEYRSGVLGAPGYMCERFYVNKVLGIEMLLRTRRRKDGSFGNGKRFIRKIGDRKWEAVK